MSKRYDHRPKSRLESVLRRLRRSSAAGGPTHSALQDMTFTIRRGETVGIIGDNGAGKSTILKLIAGITLPSEGRIETSGRVGTLIELGAGFHPELSGRENILLNGMVLGLTRQEIQGLAEEIGVFSGLGDALDHAVKYYSSGMYARLGFAVAAHVRADIMLMDEILAVGDAAFQRQCFQKFQELKDSTTILFVSHDLQRIKEICGRVLWVHGGRLQCDGPPQEVVEAYLEALQKNRERRLGQGRPLGQEPGLRRWGSGEVEILRVETCDGKGEPRRVFRCMDDMLLKLAYRVKGAVRDPGFCVSICDQSGKVIHGTNTFIQDHPLSLSREHGTVEVFYPRLPLQSGLYSLTVGAASGNNWAAPYDLQLDAQQFEIVSGRGDGGMICLEHFWSAPD